MIQLAIHERGFVLEETILWNVIKGKIGVRGGLYFFYEGTDDLLYIGKAEAFRRRVSQHMSSVSSTVGRHLSRNLPHSYLWRVKLIGLDECRKMFGFSSILACETKAIEQFGPTRFNIAGQRGVANARWMEENKGMIDNFIRKGNDERARLVRGDYSALEL